MALYMMKAVELEAEQFRADAPWPQTVKKDIHDLPYVVSAVGAIHLQDGDWIVADGDALLVYSPESFAERFEPVG